MADKSIKTDNECPDHSNLIINYLPIWYTEEDLHTLFSAVAGQEALLSIKIVRDRTTRCSMGFGFVNFDNNENAQKAVDQLSGVCLAEGKCLRVSVARPASKANIHSNLFVSGIPISFGETHIRDLFDQHKTHVESVRILKDSVTQKSRGIAVVRLDTEEIATECVNRYYGREIHDTVTQQVSCLQLKAWRPEFRSDRVTDPLVTENLLAQRRQQGFFNRAYHPVFMPPNVQPFSGEPHFVPGSPTVPNPDPFFLPGPRGSHYSGYSPMAPYNGFMGGSTTFGPGRMSPEADRDRTCLFVFHLPSNITEPEVSELFAQHGELQGVKVVQGKGYGFVDYVHQSSALMACSKLNGFKIGNKFLKVEMKKPKPCMPPFGDLGLPHHFQAHIQAQAMQLRMINQGSIIPRDNMTGLPSPAENRVSNGLRFNGNMY